MKNKAISASDLRIGGIFGFKNRTDLYVEISEIYQSGCHVIRHFYDGQTDDQPESIEDLTPIFLDADWAARAGFVEVTQPYYRERCFAKSIGDFDFELWIESQMLNFGDIVALKVPAVHVLQNKVKALTDVELEFFNV